MNLAVCFLFTNQCKACSLVIMSQIPDEGFVLQAPKRAKVVTKDIKSDLFWPVFDIIKTVTQVKATNPAWGPKRIISRFQESGRNFTCTERQVKNYISLYFYDERTDEVYYKSTDLTTGHRICITRERLVAEVRRSLEVRHGGSHNYRPCAWHDCQCAGSR